jgi:hypothetical protein
LDTAAKNAKDKMPVAQNINSAAGAATVPLSVPLTATPPAVAQGIATTNATKPVSPTITAAPTIATTPAQVQMQQAAQIEKANAAIAQKRSTAVSGITVEENQGFLENFGYTQGEGFKNEQDKADYEQAIKTFKEKKKNKPVLGAVPVVTPGAAPDAATGNMTPVATAPPTVTPPAIAQGIAATNATKPVSPTITAAPTIATNPDQVKAQQAAQIERANATIAQKPSSAGNGLMVAENQAILKKWGYTQGEGFKNRGAEAGYKTEMEQIKQKRSQSAGAAPAAAASPPKPAVTNPPLPAQPVTQDPSQLISNILTTVNQIAAELQKQADPAAANNGQGGSGGAGGAVSVSAPVSFSINSTAGENKTETTSVADKIKTDLAAFLSSPEFVDRVTSIAKQANGNPQPPRQPYNGKPL